ncbi:MAG: SoxR reducing system RseC family protein [Bacteroidales bacterium]|nr:SoxR reducing system RseC family protein [Bacteroidales bacterium]
MADFVYHQAKVTSVSTDSVDVLLEKGSACSTCHNRGACSSLDKQNMFYHIDTPNAQSFQVGEIVRIGISVNSGLKAVIYAYLIPLLLLFAAFFVARYCTPFELLQVLIGLGVVVVYYYVLFKQKHRLNKKFTFTIQKLQ